MSELRIQSKLTEEKSAILQYSNHTDDHFKPTDKYIAQQNSKIVKNTFFQTYGSAGNNQMTSDGCINIILQG